MESHDIILFDGVCNFCNRSVRFIIRRDARDRFRFAALQSPVGTELLEKYHLPADSIHSFLLIREGRVFQKSTAFLYTARYLSGLWPLCYALIIVPRFIRDACYDSFARRRYRWFGKRETCMVPDPAIRQKFL